jgi:hypothetical protein
MKRKVQINLQDSLWLIIILVIALHASSKVSGEAKHNNHPAKIELNLKKEYGGIQLQWQGNSENELSHFTVEKSADGKNFKELAVMMTAEEGRTGSLLSYQDRNQNGKSGKTFYRLRLNKKNGTYDYSNTQSIQY